MNVEKSQSRRPLTPAAVYGWLGLAFAIFLLQTLPYLSNRWVTDESWYTAPGYSIAQGHGTADPAVGPNDLENHFDARPPGTAIVIATAFKLFGTGSIPARLGSIVAGLGIILLTFRLASDVLSQEGALVATFLVATDNLIVLSSRSARPEAHTTMAVLASLLAMKQYVRKDRVHWAFLSGLLIAMGTMFHVTLLGFIVSFFVLAIVHDRKSGHFPLRGALAYGLGYILGLLPFVVWITKSPLGPSGFRAEYLSRAGGVTLWSKFLQEGHRYSDLLGLNMLHGHGLEQIPVRLPIPLLFLAATYFVWKFHGRWFYLELLLLIPTIFWLIDTVNKSSRYLSLLSPVIALTFGAAVAATSAKPRLHRAAMALCGTVIAAQICANMLLLHAARAANYNKVTAELESAIPAGQTVYGGMTFWLALHDRTYISYERTDPWMAANQFHTRYFIAGDRVMTDGFHGEEAFYADLREKMAEVISKSKLVGSFHDGYYGDLKVYEFQGI